jgi:hypothetical protein
VPYLSERCVIHYLQNSTKLPEDWFFICQHLQTLYQGINTNNYTEAWHRVLKSRYIPPPERRLLDELIQIFSEQVLPDYQMEHHKVETGTIRQTTNEFQRHTKEKGESYTTTVTHLLGIHRTQFLNHVSEPSSCWLHEMTADNCFFIVWD